MGEKPSIELGLSLPELRSLIEALVDAESFEEDALSWHTARDGGPEAGCEDGFREAKSKLRCFRALMHRLRKLQEKHWHELDGRRHAALPWKGAK